MIIDPANERLGKIRIKSVPHGEAPREIKEKWLGIELPCLYYNPAGFWAGILSEEGKGIMPCYAVLQTHALDALGMTSPEAVTWWNSAGFPRNDEAAFLFDAECVEVLKPPLSIDFIEGRLN